MKKLASYSYNTASKTGYLPFFWKWVPVYIIFSVLLFNLPYLYADLLWHDDGLYYYWASSGSNPHDYAWRGKISVLAPYRDYLYSSGMVYLGLPFTRGVIVIIMALSSLCLYYLYRNAIGLDSKVAILAAVVPNILPSLSGIPVGLNASYAVWGLLPILMSLLILQKAFDRRGWKPWLIVSFAFAFYAIGLNLIESANFLVPCVLLFFLMFFPANKIRSFLYGIPFLVYGLWQIYKQYLYSHKTPTSIPLAEVMDRMGHFFEMASFLPFNKPYSLYITLGLTIFGIFGLLSMNTLLYRQPTHFYYGRNVYRLMLVCWPLSWMVANSFAYAALSPEFRVYDYAYVFNFGAALLQAVGLLFLFILSFRILRIHTKTNVGIGVLVTCVILFTGIQRVQYKYNDWSQKQDMEKKSAFIRDNLRNVAIPQKTQIIVLGMRIDHSGVYEVNSGYIRYLLNRNDVSGLIGSDRSPNDIFSKGGNWFDPMHGFDIEKPVIAFRRNGNTLERVNFLLQVVSTGRKELPRLQWTLYDISAVQGLPRKLAAGKGMSSYSAYFHNDLPSELRGADIAFAPKENPDDFVDDISSSEIAHARGLINSEVNFGGHFTLRNVRVVPGEKGYELQALVRVDSMPDERFRLGYRLNKEGHGQEVSLWNFVMEGDNLLFHLPEVTKGKLIEGSSFELMNVGRWPPQPVVVKGGEYDQAQAINLRLTSDVNLPGKKKPRHQRLGGST